MNYLKISIVVPSFNQCSFVADCLDSILSQGYPNLELIVIDGGSTDGSLEVIRSYANHLSYWCSEPDGGHGKALIKGFKHATGEIMAWLNSDDIYFPWTLKSVACLFDTFPNVEWITGRGTIRNSNGIPTREEHDRKNKFSFLVGDIGWIQQESTFWRRSLWERSSEIATEQLNKDIMMVDSALWCVFFLSADLFNADLFLGSYRQHSTNRAQSNPILSVKETEALVCSLLWKSSTTRLKVLSLIYRAIRQLLSLYIIRIAFNTATLQRFFGIVLNPPAFRVIRHDRIQSKWLLDSEPFLFKPYRPHNLRLLISLVKQTTGSLIEQAKP